MIYSEFGRRAQSNASGGTDHGTASNIIVVGPSVKGGFYGELPSLTKLDDSRQLGAHDGLPACLRDSAG